MIRVGITGQSGFVGTHLFNTFGLYPDRFLRIPFKDAFFENKLDLQDFVLSCDVIIHLAALNRHNDNNVILNTNVALVEQIIQACKASNSSPHILFSSSTQEEKDNIYGQSKKKGRELFENWALSTGALFTGLIIPNVFGPFGNPYYNSVVATFCYQLSRNETPKIEIDGDLKLIYVADLISCIIKKIEDASLIIGSAKIERYEVPYNLTIKVSSLLNKLTLFKNQYFENGTFPDLSNSFDRNLFNTFLSYVDHNSFFSFPLKKYIDDRGSFVEVVKSNSGGQVSFSTTLPGITRGNHFHTRKAERFAVIKGKARIEFRRIGTEEKFIFELDGRRPSFVDMPVWFTHNITNIGDDEVYTIFWINEIFDSTDPDTFFELV